ncbi:PHD finger protein 21B isoform 3-T3 [Menidia menidia]
MELQGLQEALKVEIQCHQNQTLCKGLNEIQNGQKLAVRSCPVGTAKPLSLIKPPSQGIAISVVPAKAPVSMVTAQHMNGQKAGSSEQTSPVNLQTGGRAAAAGVHPFSGSRRAEELPPSQMLGTLTAVPIKVPQVSSLHRLAGQAASVLPQVRPKTHIPDSLPHGPRSPRQELQPLSLQRATAVVSPRSQGPRIHTQGPQNQNQNQNQGPRNHTQGPQNQSQNQGPRNHTQGPQNQNQGPRNQGLHNQSQSQGPQGPRGPTLPTANSTLSPAHHATATAGAGPGVAYAIIAAGNGVSAVSEAVKVIIIQPQAPSSSEGSPGVPADLPTQEAPPGPKSPKQKKEEDPEKIAFMVALGLVTTEHLEEIQTKRQERKRRSTANPAYSGLFEPERKRLASQYLNSSLFLSARDSEDYSWKEELEHEDVCAVCKEDGDLQPCHNCPRAFHPSCLQPPLTAPRGPWYCPKCQKKVLNKENMSWPQTFVQSYVTHKTVRQEEKRRLLRRNGELKKECAVLEEEDQKLNHTLKLCVDQRDRLLGQQRDAQASLDRLRTLVRLIQRQQLLQVAVTTASALLPPPRTKGQDAPGN